MGLQKAPFFVDNFPRQTLKCIAEPGKDNTGMEVGPVLQPGTPVPDH
jgi:hypothetical protein